MPLADGRLFLWERDWIVLPCFCQSFSLTHEWRVIAPFLSLPFLVNKHHPRIRTIKILDYFSVSPIHFICESPSPPIHTPIPPPPRHHLSLPPPCPSSWSAPPFLQDFWQVWGVPNSMYALEWKTALCTTSSALLCIFILFFFFTKLLTLVICSYEDAAPLLLVQGNSGVLPHLVSVSTFVWLAGEQFSQFTKHQDYKFRKSFWCRPIYVCFIYLYWFASMVKWVPTSQKLICSVVWPASMFGWLV